MAVRGKSEFPLWKVGVWANESPSFHSPKSEGLKRPEKGQLRAARGVGNFSEQPTELLPGGLGLDVREIPGGELGAAHCQTLVLLHLVEFLVEHV